MKMQSKYTTEHLNVLSEGILSRAADLFYAFRFLKLLVTKWENTPAFKLGLIDRKGKRLKDKKIESPVEKSAYTVFHRLVFNIKRLLMKIPGVSTGRLASYAAALFLIKEHTGMSENQIKKIMDRVDLEFDWDNLPLQESKWFVNDSKELNPGSYTLVNDIASPNTGEYIAMTNTRITTYSPQKPYATFLGESIYKVYHSKTNQYVFITTGDITK